MTSIDPAKISALIDGELLPEQAWEVRRAIAEDATLRAVHERLRALDAELKACAAGVMFQPRVVLPEAGNLDRSRVYLTIAALVVLRLATKLASPAVATGLAIAVLAVVVGWVLQRLFHASEEDSASSATWARVQGRELCSAAG